MYSASRSRESGSSSGTSCQAWRATRAAAAWCSFMNCSRVRSRISWIRSRGSDTRGRACCNRSRAAGSPAAASARASSSTTAGSSSPGTSSSARRRSGTAPSGPPAPIAAAAARRRTATTSASPRGGTASRCAATRSSGAPRERSSAAASLCSCVRSTGVMSRSTAEATSWCRNARVSPSARRPSSTSVITTSTASPGGRPASDATSSRRASGPRTATAWASRPAGFPRRLNRAATDRSTASGTSSLTRSIVPAASAGRPSERSAASSSPTMNGLPPVMSRHAVVSSSDVLPRCERTSWPTAWAVSGGGSTTRARGSAASQLIRSPLRSLESSRCARAMTTPTSSSPRARRASARRLARSQDWMSSTASSTPRGCSADRWSTSHAMPSTTAAGDSSPEAAREASGEKSERHGAAGPASRLARASGSDELTRRPNSCRAVPNAKSCSKSAPRADRTSMPRLRPASRAACSRAVFPTPAGPRSSTMPPAPSPAESRRASMAADSVVRSSRPTRSPERPTRAP